MKIKDATANEISYKKKRNKIIIWITIILFLMYVILVNVLISACLVPSFMERLDAFEEITEKSYSQQVQTSDIQDNRSKALAKTKEWFSTTAKEELEFTSTDGYRFVAVFFPAEVDTHNYVLMFHGYTGWKEEMYQYAYEFHQQGYNVFVPDLRCSGKSEGDYIGMGYTDSKDADLYLDYINERDKDARIVLMGQSMGAACALIMTGRDDLTSNVVAAISDCSYTDAYSMFEDKIKEWFSLPAFPLVDSAVFMLKLRGGYDLRRASAIEAVKKSHIPTLFIHGSDDKMISVNMAYELYDNAACEKELLIVDGAGHAQAADKEPEKYYDTIFSFLERY